MKIKKIFLILIIGIFLVSTGFVFADENELTEDILKLWKNCEFDYEIDRYDADFQVALWEGSTSTEKLVLWNELESTEKGFEKQKKFWSLLNNNQKQIAWFDFLGKQEINSLAKVMIGKEDLIINNLEKIPRNTEKGLSLISYKLKTGDYFFGITGEHIKEINFKDLKLNNYLKEINFENDLNEELSAEGKLVLTFDPRKENKKEDFRIFKFNSGSVGEKGHYYDERGKQIANVLYGSGGEISAEAIYEDRLMKGSNGEDVILSDYIKTVFNLKDEKSLLRVVNPDNQNQEFYFFGKKENQKSSVEIDYLLNTFSANTKIRSYENKNNKLLHTASISIGDENVNIVKKRGYDQNFEKYVQVNEIWTYDGQDTINIKVAGIRDFLSILPQKTVNNMDIKDSINVELYDIKLISNYPSIKVDREVVRLNNNQLQTVTVDKLRYYHGEMSYIINAVRTGEETGRIAQVLKAANVPRITTDIDTYIKTNFKSVTTNVEGKIRKSYYEPEPINDYINKISKAETSSEKIASWKEFIKSNPNIQSYKEDHYYLVGKLKNKDIVKMWVGFAYEYDTSKKYALNEYNINHFWNLLTDSNQKKLARIFKEHYNFGTGTPKAFLAESIRAAQEAKKNGREWELV